MFKSLSPIEIALIKKLSGKTYYIRVKAFKTDSTGAKVFGKYGTVKSIKIYPDKEVTYFASDNFFIEYP